MAKEELTNMKEKPRIIIEINTIKKNIYFFLRRDIVKWLLQKR